MAITGVMCHTGLSGVVFAKFTLGNRHELSCAFSTVLYAIPCVEYHHNRHHYHRHRQRHRLEDSFISEDSNRSLHYSGNSQRSDTSYCDDCITSFPLRVEESTVQLCFRLVNVFHRHFFGVNIRCFLVEHHPSNTDGWVCPSVEEISDISTSIPLEFMSLPVEVAVTVPYKRVDTRIDTPRGARGKVKPGRLTKRKDRQRPHQAAEQHFDLEESGLLAEEGHKGSTEFELVCTIEFTDATTGRVIGVRKSWNLHKVIWMPEGIEKIEWHNIVHRRGNSGCYDVDVDRLDKIDFSYQQYSRVSTPAGAQGAIFDGSVIRIRDSSAVPTTRSATLLRPVMRVFQFLSASRSSTECTTRPLLERLNAGEH